MKKLTKPQLKKILPNGLYKNTKLDKRGKAELKKVISIRLTEGELLRMNEEIKPLGITQANFIRYAIKVGLADIEERIKNEEK